MGLECCLGLELQIPGSLVLDISNWPVVTKLLEQLHVMKPPQYMLLRDREKLAVTKKICQMQLRSYYCKNVQNKLL